MKWVNVIQIEGVFSPWLGSGKKVLLATVSLVHLQFNCYSRTLRSKIEGYVALKNEAVYEFFEDGLILWK